MLTTAGAASRTTGAKDSAICSRERGTSCALPGPAARAAHASTQARMNRIAPRPVREDESAATTGLQSAEVPVAISGPAEPASSGGGLARFLFVGLRPGPRILALGRDVAVDELDHRHGRVVAQAKARLENAHVAVRPLGIARAEHVVQLARGGRIAGLGDQKAPGVQIAALAQRHQLLDVRPKLLRLGQRGGDLLVLDQG